MASRFLLTLLLVVSSALANVCTNVTVPVTINAQQPHYTGPEILTKADATLFAQDFTRIANNAVDKYASGERNVTGTYDIGATFCTPDNSSSAKSALQFLTHGIGFDRSYWNIPFNGFNYSYVKVANDEYGYSTVAIDRLGVGESYSPDADPLNTIQALAEVSVIYQLTNMLRNGTFPNVSTKFDTVVHVGHSFGSIQSYALSALHPEATDGLVLTGFSFNSTWLSLTIAGWALHIASLNQPLRFGSNETGGQNLPPSYLTWADISANQYAFLYKPYYDPGLGEFAESTKQPVTTGELFSLAAGGPATTPFDGPVIIFTGEQDNIFCGGDCLATGDPSIANIPAAGSSAFPNASAFEAYIQPNSGHGLNAHYNATAGYRHIQSWLESNGL